MVGPVHTWTGTRTGNDSDRGPAADTTRPFVAPGSKASREGKQGISSSRGAEEVNLGMSQDAIPALPHLPMSPNTALILGIILAFSLLVAPALLPPMPEPPLALLLVPLIIMALLVCTAGGGKQLGQA